MIQDIDLGNYQYNKQDLIGKGSFAEVYQGIQKITNIVVAIKIIDKQSFIQYPQLKQLAENEIFINKKIDHENVVAFYDSMETQNEIIIIQEYCNDGNLTQQIQQNLIDEVKAKIIIVQILKGLQILWQNGVMHRDLKPDNILIHNGIYKIADFGLSDILQSQNETKNDKIGTPLYMCPQMFFLREYNLSCDIWSLGCLLYEMLNKEMPFQGKNSDEVFCSINTKHTKVLQNISQQKNIDYQCKSFLVKCLQFEEKERFNVDNIFKHQYISEIFDFYNLSKNLFKAQNKIVDVLLESAEQKYDEKQLNLLKYVIQNVQTMELNNLINLKIDNSITQSNNHRNYQLLLNHNNMKLSQNQIQKLNGITTEIYAQIKNQQPSKNDQIEQPKKSTIKYNTSDNFYKNNDFINSQYKFYIGKDNLAQNLKKYQDYNKKSVEDINKVQKIKQQFEFKTLDDLQNNSQRSPTKNLNYNYSTKLQERSNNFFQQSLEIKNYNDQRNYDLNKFENSYQIKELKKEDLQTSYEQKNEQENLLKSENYKNIYNNYQSYKNKQKIDDQQKEQKNDNQKLKSNFKNILLKYQSLNMKPSQNDQIQNNQENFPVNQQNYQSQQRINLSQKHDDKLIQSQQNYSLQNISQNQINHEQNDFILDQNLQFKNFQQEKKMIFQQRDLQLNNCYRDQNQIQKQFNFNFQSYDCNPLISSQKVQNTQNKYNKQENFLIYNTSTPVKQDNIKQNNDKLLMMPQQQPAIINQQNYTKKFNSQNRSQSIDGNIKKIIQQQQFNQNYYNKI